MALEYSICTILLEFSETCSICTFGKPSLSKRRLIRVTVTLAIYSIKRSCSEESSIMRIDSTHILWHLIKPSVGG